MKQDGQILRDLADEIERELAAGAVLKLYTLAEAAELLTVSQSTIRRYVDGGQLRVIRHGRVVRVLDSELRRFLRSWSGS